MNFAFMYADTTSTNPQMLLLGMLIVFLGGTAAGYYDLDYLGAAAQARLMQHFYARAATPQLA